MLESEGIGTRVVSMPSWELFEKQEDAYKKETLNEDTVRIAVEAGCSMGWEKYTGTHGGFVGINSFGASAPAGDLYNHFGITAEAIVASAKDRL